MNILAKKVAACRYHAIEKVPKGTRQTSYLVFVLQWPCRCTGQRAGYILPLCEWINDQ